MSVRAIVRSADRLPSGIDGDSRLTVVEADLLSLSVADLAQRIRGCDAVVSCLGHVASLRGIFGPPRDLVAQATRRLCRAIEEAKPPDPVRFVLMSSVTVNHPEGLDPPRGILDKMIVCALDAVLPPMRDNQGAADVLHDDIGAGGPYIQWVAVRPDTLLPGDVTEYELHETRVDSFVKPGSTNMANVAHFMCELVTDSDAWVRWRGRLPIVVNAPAANG